MSSSRQALLAAEGGAAVVWDVEGEGDICSSPVARASYAPLGDGEDSALLSSRRVSSSMGATGAAVRRSGGGGDSGPDLPVASAGAASALQSVKRRIALAVVSAKEQRSERVRKAALETQVANNAKFMANLVSEEDRVFAEIALRKEQERRDAELAAQLGAQEASHAPAAPPLLRNARGGVAKQLRVRVVIPRGTPPGGRFLVDLPGHGRLQVDAPPGTVAGDEIQFVVPARAPGGDSVTAARAQQRMVPRPEDIAAMVTMGFAERLCARALAEPSSGGSRRTVADATDWLLEHLESLEREDTEQEQESAAAVAAAAATEPAAADAAATEELAAAAHGSAAAAPPMPPTPAVALACAPAAAAAPPNEALARLQTAKAMLDAGLITAEEYDATKRDILAALATGGAARAAAAPTPPQSLAQDLLDL